ncbi:YbaN family protein [Aurantiacibacter poecillastricola]|uniref:YbaN family protein n=1 Tax=Aurantiacibacter poecillastricola TaxID=3064385 RepID=UPI00273D1DEB|nr:YbaN family protein [Aurantiacibacter sp. 219JJ12-13]MDP5262974.1 YbaN family protein [Aurantiacibacter sp. 219JJ12-13]
MARPLWMAAGVVCFVLGWIGMILPMMPGFVFLLGALFCFARGNPAWEARLLDHPTYGPPLRDWREHRRIARRSKLMALAFMVLAGVLAGIMVGFPLAIVPIAVMTLVAGWIWTRPE